MTALKGGQGRSDEDIHAASSAWVMVGVELAVLGLIVLTIVCCVRCGV